MKVILLEGDEAFEFWKAQMLGIVEEAVANAMAQQPEKKSNQVDEADPWCFSEEARRILGCGKTKLQELRDGAPENGLKIFRISPRKYKYDRQSLYDYIRARELK